MSSSTFQTQRDVYLDLTHQLNDYNEINNLNEYLLSMNNIEFDQLTTYNDVIRSKLLKLKQQYMLTDTSNYDYKMKTNITLYTIIVTAILLSAVAQFSLKKISGKMLTFICLFVGIIYCIVTLYIIYKNINRRKYDWNTYYFDPIKSQAA